MKINNNNKPPIKYINSFYPRLIKESKYSYSYYLYRATLDNNEGKLPLIRYGKLYHFHKDRSIEEKWVQDFIKEDLAQGYKILNTYIYNDDYIIDLEKETISIYEDIRRKKI